jgi:uncharacterized protein YciI
MSRRTAAISLVAALLLGLAASASAQTEPVKYEFASYVVVYAERGSNWKSQSEEEGMAVRMEVIDNLKKAFNNKQLIIAGLVSDESGAEFIAILQTEDDAALRQILNGSKNVANGFFKLRFHSWQAPAGLKLEPVVRK